MTEQPGESAFLRRFRESLASFPLTRDDIKVSTFPRLERLKKRRQTSGLLHFCPLVAFFQKTAVRRKRRSLVSPLSWLMFGVSLPLFGLFFCQRTRGEGKSFIFFRGDDIFIQTKDTRLRKEEERRKKSERTSFERERERSVVFSYIYLLL